MYEVSVAEIEKLSREQGAFVERSIDAPDQLGRTDVHWTQVIVRVPDDGTGALPLLRSIVINDTKSSTYKLALLKSLSLIAGGAAGYAKDNGDEYVSVPFGLVGLYWIRLFKPLLSNGLPQTPRNVGVAGLGFVNLPFENLMQRSDRDLRPGEKFQGDYAADLHKALQDVCVTVAKMPAHYITNAQGKQVFTAGYQTPGRTPGSILLTQDYLQSFGEFVIPLNIWRALMRFGPWIEPAIDAEWIRMMKRYAESQNCAALDDRVIQQAIAWNDPNRDTKRIRAIVEGLWSAGKKIRCVWSERSLSADNLNIDHWYVEARAKRVNTKLAHKETITQRSGIRSGA